MIRTIEDIRKDIDTAEIKVKELWEEFHKFRDDCLHLDTKAGPGPGVYNFRECLHCGNINIY